MKITLTREIDFTDASTYTFLPENGKEYTGNKTRGFFSKINLWDESIGKAKYVIDQKWNWFKTLYAITVRGNGKLYFKSINIWTRHFQCIDDDETYDIYGHRGLKCSIYKSGRQIAFWEKEPLSINNKVKYLLTVDDECEYHLISCFCMILDSINNVHNDSFSFTSYDLGDILAGAVPFDESWRPNIKPERPA